MTRLTDRNYKNTTLALDSCKPYLKLGELEDLEEELGIDLITLFKALNGFYYKKKVQNIKTKKLETLIEYSSYAYLYYDDVGTCFISTFDRDFYLSRYGIDWALTKEELMEASLGLLASI